MSEAVYKVCRGGEDDNDNKHDCQEQSPWWVVSKHMF
jgi:hypothetical protein